MADETADRAARRERVQQALQVLDAEGTYAACRRIERSGTPAEAVQLYHDLIPALYFQRKDVRVMVAIGRAGIHYGLTQAGQLRDMDPDGAEKLAGATKAIAYDLGANLWPGWQEEGIELSPADLATGMEAAKLNLSLAESLKRPPLPMCNARWLLGAHELARGDAAAAEREFGLAAEQAVTSTGATVRSVAFASPQILTREAARSIRLPEN